MTTVPCPKLRENMQSRRIRASIDDFDSHQDIVGRVLGVLDGDVEILASIENARVHEFEFRIGRTAAPILLDKPVVGKSLLRIFVKHPHVGVARNAVAIVI